MYTLSSVQSYFCVHGFTVKSHDLAIILIGFLILFSKFLLYLWIIYVEILSDKLICCCMSFPDSYVLFIHSNLIFVAKEQTFCIFFFLKPQTCMTRTSVFKGEICKIWPEFWVDSRWVLVCEPWCYPVLARSSATSCLVSPLAVFTHSWSHNPDQSWWRKHRFHTNSITLRLQVQPGFQLWESAEHVWLR